jgi:transposase
MMTLSKHFDTPRKSRVNGAVDFARRQKERYGYDFLYNDIFKTCGVGKTRGYEILKSFNKQFAHKNVMDETRGRPRLLSELSQICRKVGQC